jgi:hypothetical protein
VRTVVATTGDTEAFGWQVAAEVHRRGLDCARRKACLADGSRALCGLFELHLVAAGFIGVLDFVHLLVHLYAAAGATAGRGSDAARGLYVEWIGLAWAGQVVALLAAPQVVQDRLGPPPRGAKEGDPRRVVAETIGYVRNNRKRMDYPQYRRLGLPISSAAVESTIKRMNRRIKGSEKFWLTHGAEAVAQVRAAYLSEDDRVDRYRARPRRGRAVGPRALRPTARQGAGITGMDPARTRAVDDHRAGRPGATEPPASARVSRAVRTQPFGRPWSLTRAFQATYAGTSARLLANLHGSRIARNGDRP